jgi:hypothetical protein
MGTERAVLGVGDDVRIRFFDAFDLVNLGNHHIGERSFIVRRDEQEDIRLAEAGMRLLDSCELLQ